MSKTTPKNLRDLREHWLGYRLDAVARFTGISRERLGTLEDDPSSLTVYEAEVLARVYGIEAERLVEQPIPFAPGDSIKTLASLDEFREVDDAIRVRIVAAANAARDFARLRQMEGSNTSQAKLLKLTGVGRNRPPFRQGAEYARKLRRTFNLGSGPIKSIRDFLSESFPEIVLLYANLGREGPAGLTFANRLRGPTIVLNLEGKNENPCVRRFSLAHELCHLLVDWNRQEPLALISGFMSDVRLEREQIANAFAIRLLCPESVLQRIRAHKDHPEKAVQLLKKYGLHYAAIRLYLHNEARISLPFNPPPLLADIGMEVEWQNAEEPAGIAKFPLSEAPPERRTLIAQVAARLYSAGRMSRDEFGEMLGVTSAADLERVLDFLGLDVPAIVA